MFPFFFFLINASCVIQGFPGGSVVKNLPAKGRRRGFDPWVGKIPWRKKWQPTPVLLPGKSHEQKSLADCRPRALKRVRHHLVTKQQQHLVSYSPTAWVVSLICPLLMLSNVFNCVHTHTHTPGTHMHKLGGIPTLPGPASALHPSCYLFLPCREVMNPFLKHTRGKVFVL